MPEVPLPAPDVTVALEDAVLELDGADATWTVVYMREGEDMPPSVKGGVGPDEDDAAVAEVETGAGALPYNARGGS